MSYTIIVYENSHYRDESESYKHGEFETAEAALAAAQKIVDESLDQFYKPGITPEDLYRQYATFGDDPVIVPTVDPTFSGWDYAKERCLVLCAPPPEEPAKEGAYISWFKVTFDDAAIDLDVSPPAYEAWRAQIEWARIGRICFKTGGFLESDELYIFTDERPESHVIPVDAAGGYELWDEILRRGIFNAEMAIRAAASPGGELFCDPDR